MKIFGVTVALLLALAVACGALFYERPLWVTDQRLHYRMWRAGERSQFVDLPEGRIHFYEQRPSGGGDGVPLLLVHGLGGRAEDFAGLMPRFAAQGFHVYALDLLGYGKSARPAESDFSITTEEKVVADFMDAQHLAHADIAGWSMGGWIVLELALDMPQRVDRLAVYDSAGLIFDSPVDVSWFAPKDDAGVARLIRTMSPTMAMPPAFVARDIIRRTGKIEWVDERSLGSMRSGRDVVDFRLARLQPPLLIVYGAEDVLTPPGLGAKMHQIDPRSTFVTVEGCGHFAPVECSKTVGNVSVEFFKGQAAVIGGEMKLAR